MNKKQITAFTLAMINIAAIGSVKNWPTMAEYGFSALFYLLLGAIVFFIPTALVSAELATGWPKMGGIFVWVKEAFGHRLGFLAIWLLWIENVIWYPTVLTFIASTVAYLIDPALSENKLYLLGTSLIAFWSMTYVNLKGMRISGWVSTFGVVIGTFIPAVVIISLGLQRILSHAPLQITLDLSHFIPNMSHPQEWVIFVGILLSLCGMEMSAIHARDVANPQKNYPKATLITLLLVMGLSILGVLSIASVVPQQQISLTAGSMQAFVNFVDIYQLHWLVPGMAVLMVMGAMASLSTWIVGPSRGLLAAAQHGDLPPFCRKLNHNEMPRSLLLIQGAIVSLLSLMFIWMPTVNSAYWILSAMVAQVYLVMYVLLFAAAIRLRYRQPHVVRSYQIPGGKWGMWLVAGIGIASSTCAWVIGFFPPAQFQVGSLFFYVSFLLGGVLLICLAPTLILTFKKPHWESKLQHETTES